VAYLDISLGHVLLIGDGTAWRDVRGDLVAGTGAGPSGPPRNLRAVVESDDSIVLTWDAVPDATSYTLYEDQSPDGVSGATALTATTTTRTPSTHRTYHYWVTATVGGVESGPSDKVAATLPHTSPSTGGITPTGTERSEQVRLTGYSYQDNTPPSSAIISMPVIHQVAGGVGTFDDPITAAVPGHAASGVETPAGTTFYVPDLRRYFIVEDSGATEVPGIRHFDLWVDGQGFTKSDSDKCASSCTGTRTAIFNPGPDHPVNPGPLTGHGGCVGIEV
jgi:hypothetical protein